MNKFIKKLLAVVVGILLIYFIGLFLGEKAEIAIIGGWIFYLVIKLT